MRLSLTACLEEAGFEVWAATSGIEMIDTYLRHRDSVDVLFIEADLPDLPAPALYDRLRNHLPEVPCCFFSPATAGPNTTEVRAKGATVVLWPTPVDQLVDTLWAEVLATTPMDA
jgi:CheY-like chemotaxis protein